MRERASDPSFGSIAIVRRAGLDMRYNLKNFSYGHLNVLRLETYAQDAERDGDQELAEFFRRAQGESRKGAEQGKALLAARIAG